MYLKSLAIHKKASISLKKSSNIIEIFIKVPNFLTWASISLKLSSKTLQHFKKASIPVKMSSKNLVIVEKASDVLLKPHFSENVFKKPQNCSKCLTLLEKSLLLSLNVLKKLRIFWKTSHHFKKALIPLEMHLKSFAFFEKPSHILKSLNFSEIVFKNNQNF
jgi:hypothetical protein